MNIAADGPNAVRIPEPPLLRRVLHCRLLTACFLLLLTASLSHAAPPVVTNVPASQSPLTRQVEIRYDLQDADSATVRVSLLVSEDGGGT